MPNTGSVLIAFIFQSTSSPSLSSLLIFWNCRRFLQCANIETPKGRFKNSVSCRKIAEVFSRKEAGKGGRKWRDQRQNGQWRKDGTLTWDFYHTMEPLVQSSGCPPWVLPPRPWPSLLHSLLSIVLEQETLLLAGCCFPSPSEGRDQGWDTRGGLSDGNTGEGLPACAKHAVESPCSFF